MDALMSYGQKKRKPVKIIMVTYVYKDVDL